MQHLLDVIAGVVQPWTDYYASSSGIETTVMFLHLGGMVAAGGLAFTLDRIAAFRSPLCCLNHRICAFP